jgi:hypothetical protein
MTEFTPNDGESCSYGYIDPTAIHFESVSDILEQGIDNLTTSVPMTEPFFLNQLEILDGPSPLHHPRINDRSAFLPHIYYLKPSSMGKT